MIVRYYVKSYLFIKKLMFKSTVAFPGISIVMHVAHTTFHRGAPASSRSLNTMKSFFLFEHTLRYFLRYY